VEGAEGEGAKKGSEAGKEVTARTVCVLFSKHNTHSFTPNFVSVVLTASYGIAFVFSTATSPVNPTTSRRPVISGSGKH